MSSVIRDGWLCTMAAGTGCGGGRPIDRGLMRRGMERREPVGERSGIRECVCEGGSRRSRREGAKDQEMSRMGRVKGDETE